MGIELLDLDALCERADMITLHLPVTPQTRGLFNAERFARCRPHALIVNTARGELIDVNDLKAALDAGTIGGAGLDVFEVEPPADWSIAQHPKVVATPHIAGSTSEAQELVGIDVAVGVREYLLHGVVRNAVNFPSVPADEFSRLQPFMTLAERLGQVAGQLADGPIHTVGVRYSGALANGPSELTTGSVLVGLFRRILSSGVTLINARALAGDRGVEVTETRSSRPRTFANLISVKVHTPAGEHWVEGTVFGADSPRITSVDGVSVEAALEGTLLIIRNDDQPGVIGEVGTRLGRHGVNIATFALGRADGGAVGVVSVDEKDGAEVSDAVLADIRTAPHVRSVTVARIL
jgi:D-3-phosphoglycerate dehydrogenase